MPSANKIVDDISRVFSGAMGVAQGAAGEAENAMKSFVSKLIADKDFVTREEFEAVSLMAQNAREEVELLKKEIASLKPKKVAKKKTTKDA